MFGGPPPQSEEEIAQQEQVAQRTVQVAVASSILLYLSPLVIDYVRKLI